MFWKTNVVSFWKVEHVIFNKTQFDFWDNIFQQKKQHFSIYRRFIFNIFWKNSEEKKVLNNLAKFLFTTRW